MSLVLYRKYRPKHFDEIVGQEHVTGALVNAIRMGKIAHAYLFSGPRGVGKTTIARLIAKSVNCIGTKKPCNSCDLCEDFNQGRAVDLIEIDAASNRGIDEVRELRDGVRFVPVRGKYKTYVIDECHMLTREAFNALLKTLEEPPPHAIFVLATTELEKVPATIVSRTQHYDFRRPSVSQIVGKILHIAKKEGIDLAEDAAHLVACAAEGSLRDAESILGQIAAVENKKITRAAVEDILGLPRREAAKKMFSLIASGDTSGALLLIQEIADSGHDLFWFSKILLQYFRSALFLKTDPVLKKFVAEELLPDEIECLAVHLPSLSSQFLSSGMQTIMDNLPLFKRTPVPELPLELTVLELISRKTPEEKTI